MVGDPTAFGTVLVKPPAFIAPFNHVRFAHGPIVRVALLVTSACLWTVFHVCVVVLWA